MPSQVVPGASLDHVAATMIDQYGRHHVKEKERSPNRAVWVFRIAAKSWGKCVATSTPNGVAVTMTPYLLPWLINTAIGFVLCVIPGIAMSVVTLIAWIIGNSILSHRFPPMIATLKQYAAGTVATDAVPVAP